MSYLLGIDSTETVEFYPEWDYKFPAQQIRTDHRTKGGKLFVYKWGSYQNFNLNLNWVTASDASLVNSWWDTNTKLLFFITSDTGTEVHSVMIINDDTPFSQYNKPYNNYFGGKVELTTY